MWASFALVLHSFLTGETFRRGLVCSQHPGERAISVIVAAVTLGSLSPPSPARLHLRFRKLWLRYKIPASPRIYLDCPLTPKLPCATLSTTTLRRTDNDD